MRNLALFDFDGTITTKDSFIEFIKFYSGWQKILLGVILLLPRMVLFKLGFITNWKAKEYVLTWFFKGESASEVSRRGQLFCQRVIPRLLKKEAILKLEEHKANGDKIILVSASAEDWLAPWTKTVGIDLIGTRLQVENGKLTGKIDGYNCYGIQKVNRIKEAIDLSEFKSIYAYGDSRGDREMLALADYPSYRVFSA